MNTKLAPPEVLLPAPVAPTIAPEALVQSPAREALLQELLGVDYGYAKDSGLVELFDYNPTTGEDGLVHMLAGDIDTGKGDIQIPGGFHHEESGRVWGAVRDKQGGERPITRVLGEHLAEANAEHRKKYRRRPAEPYLAQVAIGDRSKMYVSTNAKGEPRLEMAKNSMYPVEYDALAVLQAVRTAYQNREMSHARPGYDDRGRPVLAVDGQAILLDGVSTMPIRMLLNPENMRIRTAFPVIKSKSGIMKLTPEQMWAHATNQTSTSILRS